MKTFFTLENALKVAGAGHFVILSASALVPLVLDWRGSMKGLPPFLRNLFWVYGAFIVLTIVGMGTLTLMHAQGMALGDPVARSVAGFIAIFWTARLLVQLFVFDARPHLTNAWLKAGYHLLTAAFAFFVVVYAIAATQMHIRF